MDITSRDGRNYQWLLIAVLIREGKFAEAETQIEDRMEHYFVARKLLDERILQREVLAALNREAEIVGFLEHDILNGDKADWDTISYFCQCVSDRTIHCFDLPYSARRQTGCATGYSEKVGGT